MSREIFSKHGILEDTEITNDREETRLRDLKESGHRPPELEFFLDKIVFERLRSLFLEVAQKGGLEKDTDLNFLGRDRIFAKQHWYRGGIHNPVFNNILLLLRGVPNYCKTAESRGSELRTLQSLVHEETHAVGKNICVGWHEHPDHSDEPEHIQSGYNSYNLLEDEDLFRFLNEAVTEKLSREISARYMQEVGWPGATDEEIKVFVQKLTAAPNPHDEDNLSLSYSVEVEVLNTLIQRLAEKQSLPKETIWKAFVRGFFEGQSLDEQNVKQLFNETFGPTFLSELSQLPLGPYSNHKKVKGFKSMFNLTAEPNIEE